MNAPKKPQKSSPQPQKKKSHPQPQAEGIILSLGLGGFLLFMIIVAGGLFLARNIPRQSLLAAMLPPAPPTAIPTVILPGVAPPLGAKIPTPLPTIVYEGTPYPQGYATRLPRAPKQFAIFRFPAFGELGPQSPQAVLDLARIMQGESGGDIEAAYRVGWVAKNRVLHSSYGTTYRDVALGGFWGYRANINPTPAFLQMAQRVIRGRRDPTAGCLYALSRTDITNLGVPPSRADLNYNEWFFFRTWPLSARS